MKRSRTKIIATLGPASNSKTVISALFDAGVDVFRMNFSHGTHADHKKVYDIIRSVERANKRPIAVLADLQGPKLRLGEFKNGKVALQKGQTYRFDMQSEAGDETRAPLPHKEIFKILKKGELLLVDDGRMRFEITGTKGSTATAKVLTSGTLSAHKGVNLPGAHLPISAITGKDMRDLSFALSLGVDWVALSFVQGPEDVAELRKLVGGKAAVISKLEKPLAISKLEQILELSDAVMVARGDLGVEMPPEDVPILQKEIIRSGRRLGKPVIVATQMLESMIQNPAPTRAEASDVAAAVYDGADAVMLSGETAMGAWPVEAAKMMERITHRVEQDPGYRRLLAAAKLERESTTPDAVMAAAHLAADTIKAAAIVTYTSSGSTAIRASRERPIQRIIGLTPSRKTARRLALVWGVTAIEIEDAKDIDDMTAKATAQAKTEGVAKVRDRIVVTAGIPFGTPGKTNLMRIARVD